MIALHALEERLLAHLRKGAGFPREWCAQGLVDSDLGLSIYANAYHSRLREALEADHAQLAAYLGDALWAEFCAGYIEAHPSRVRSLRHFGVQVPAWLGTHAPFTEHPEIAELALFERELLDVFDAADDRRIDWAAMQALDVAAWPSVRLGFHPSVCLLPTQTNAVEIWRALKETQPPPAVSPSATPARLLWRDAERVSRFRPVDADELLALQEMVSAQQDFAAMCARLAGVKPASEVPALAIGFLRQWFDEGIISHLEIASEHAPAQRYAQRD
ncbi:MAG: putative DNA-binding domain-containing protein [Xanthomonadales bacterium]|uniref:HvfC/BufC family peptide modification chaperone n=1 Tax=Dokdonella sp. TaxID=2291710 RepID=UPI002B8189A7|nr:putative DNA-binding domain-containing protein [Xanthomonadales bacterium]HQV72209.1 DNA-binding domain-containing protein [Dokdonella sp.]MBK7013203.1 putative DNA-binding domain-containing protein [Xanthomonadales bacterium]MBK7211647.1 putative DNA-binding domain-containing protein [Xanthomonadales bacterium]MBL0221190.1 putative DNA-binding domain-containing protein [Xanthomonadales bacterium]